MKNLIHSIGPAEKVPESFVEKWGGEWGHPAEDENGNKIGYVAGMPSICPTTPEEEELADKMWQEAVDTFVAL